MGIAFYLNDEMIEIDAPRADETVLDFLRETMRLKGTKEGCREGDCGACTVLVGRVRNGELHYHSLNACIAFLPMMHRSHLITIEALSADGKLHWVQDALMRHHGSQCGFCTPGIVMSLYAAWMNAQSDSGLQRQDWQVALQGNLCRCTGYASILRAMVNEAPQTRADDPLVLHRADIRAKLDALPKGMISVSGNAPFFMPQNLRELETVCAAHPDARLVAGATDVGLWVTKGFREIAPVIFLGQVEELSAVEVRKDEIQIGALLTIDEAAKALKDALPELNAFWMRFAGPQIRNHATIGGSVANGSPIGDIAPILIAVDAKMTLNHGGERRELSVEDYFIDYGQQDIHKGEFVEGFRLPRQPIRLEVCKVSKRPDEDISAMMCALAFLIEDDQIKSARLAFGGMAATPKRARNAESALEAKPLSEASFRAAMKALEDDFTPIDDMRASKAYRLKAAQNALLRAFHNLQNSQETAAE